MNRVKTIYYKIASIINNRTSNNSKFQRFFEELTHFNINNLFINKEDFIINLQENKIKARLIKQKKPSDKVIIFIHGGGFIKGSISSYTRMCSKISKRTNSNIILLSYRLSPTYPYPYPLNDCYLSLKELLNNEEYNLQNRTIYLMGDEIGANLAISASYLLYKNSDYTNLKHILLYPSLSNKYNNYNKYPSYKKYKDDYFLTSTVIDNYYNNYLPLESDRMNPLTGPLQMKNYNFLNDVLIITCEYDPLKDEGLEFSKKLKEEKINVEYNNIKKSINGFYHMKCFYKQKKELEEIVYKFIYEGDNNE